VQPIPAEVFETEFRWLGILVEDQSEMFPRTRITTVPYAYASVYADTSTYALQVLGGASHWSAIDSILYTDHLWGLARGNSQSVLHGDNAFTHVNLGIACTTGTGGENLFYSAALGGYGNSAHSSYSTVSGGVHNQANGQYSTVAGGKDNVAQGTYSFAGGNRAKALHSGTFVWGDALDEDVESQRNNQFRVRARGGMRFDINSDGWVEIFDNTAAIISTSTGARLTVAGIWANSSDENLKENFEDVDRTELLQKLDQLRITEWKFKSEDDDVKHIGPTAQDFRAVFGYGTDDRTVNTVDPVGIALAAIQELYKKSQEVDSLRNRLYRIEAQLDQLLKESDR
jgi:hypothetical protein